MPLISFGKLLLAASFLLLASCTEETGSKKGDKDTNPRGTEIDFNPKISSKDCRDPFIFVSDWQEELSDQIRTGDAPCVKAALERGAKANVIADDFFKGPTLPIFLALEKSALWFTKHDHDAFAVVKVLVDAGADLNSKNGSGQTPLFLVLSNPALLKDYPTVPLYIVQTGKVNLDETNQQGDTALHSSIRTKQTEIAKALVNEGADAEVRTRSGVSPLMLAFDSQLEDLANFLVDKPVDLQVRDSQDNFPIHRAARLQYEKLALKIITKMSTQDLNHQNSNEETALYISISGKLTKVITALLGKGVDPDLRTAESSPIHRALSSAQSDVALQLIEKIQNLDGKDKQGDTPLVLATVRNDLRAMKALLQRGASVEITTTKGATPLHMAQSLSAAELLVQAGSPVNTLSQNGLSPLAEAVRNGQPEIAKYLILQKADPKWVGKDGKTLLHLAIAKNDLTLSNLLFEQNLSVNSADSSGSTPLFAARSVESIDLLNSKGAELDYSNNAGTTVLEMHVRSYLQQPNDHLLQMITRLIQLGANVDETDERSNSLLQLTVMSTPLIASSDFEGYYTDLLPLLAAKARIDMVNAEGNSALHYANRAEEVHILNRHSANPNIKNREGLTPLAMKRRSDQLLQFEEERIQKKIEQAQEDLKEAQEQGNTRLAERLEVAIDVLNQEAKRTAATRSELAKVAREIEKIGGKI